MNVSIKYYGYEFENNNKEVVSDEVDGENVTKQIKDEMLSVNLGDNVALCLSAENGIIIGIATYAHQTTQYLIRYKTADGRQIESWWTRDAFRKEL